MRIPTLTLLVLALASCAATPSPPSEVQVTNISRSTQVIEFATDDLMSASISIAPHAIFKFPSTTPGCLKPQGMTGLRLERGVTLNLNLSEAGFTTISRSPC